MSDSPSCTTTTYSYNAKGDLENIKDGNGLVTKTFTYDSEGKAIRTAGINGVNKKEFDYSNEKTIVSALIGETDYHFRVLNSKLLTTKKVTDEGVETIKYDSNGYLFLIIKIYHLLYLSGIMLLYLRRFKYGFYLFGIPKGVEIYLIFC